MLCGVGENGQIDKTIWKINLKQKRNAAVRRVNTGKLQPIKIKLMVAKSVFKDFNIHFMYKERASKRMPSYCIKL